MAEQCPSKGRMGRLGLGLGSWGLREIVSGIGLKALPRAGPQVVFKLSEPHPLWPWDSPLEGSLVMVSVVVLGFPSAHTCISHIYTLVGRRALPILCRHLLLQFLLPHPHGGKYKNIFYLLKVAELAFQLLHLGGPPHLFSGSSYSPLPSYLPLPLVHGVDWPLLPRKTPFRVLAPSTVQATPDNCPS